MRYHKIISSLVAQFTQHYRINTTTNGQQQPVFWLKKIIGFNIFFETVKQHGGIDKALQNNEIGVKG